MPHERPEDIPLPVVPFPGVAECRRLNRNYERRRKAYRKRVAGITYTAPEEIQPLRLRALEAAKFEGAP